jgi:deoxyribonuclease-4
MFGSHLSIAGSMCNALADAQRLGMDTVQVFTKNQQQWKAKPLDAGLVKEWRAEVARLGWDADGGRIVSHASYLINLASPDDALWKKSIELMRDEVERCEALGIPFLVHHPGAYTTSTGVEGLARIAAAYKTIVGQTKGFRTVLCLENTVGAGSVLGRSFEELAALRASIVAATGEPARVGFCFDTCHAHAGGYDMSTRAGAEAVLDQFDALCGLANLKAMHLNDSKGGVASRLDRHAHIGEGTIGAGAKLKNSGFAAVVNDERLRNLPKILETPKEKHESGEDWDAVNLKRLKDLQRVTGGQAKGASPANRAVAADVTERVLAARRRGPNNGARLTRK